MNDKNNIYKVGAHPFVWCVLLVCILYGLVSMVSDVGALIP